MRSRITLVTVAAVALLLGFAGAATAQEDPAVSLDLEPLAAVEGAGCEAPAADAEGQLALADANEPLAAGTCWVENQWRADSCSCPGGYVRERLYQRVCCPWGCGAWGVTSSTRCTPQGCFP